MSARSPDTFWRVLAHLVVLRPLVKLLYGVRVTGGGNLRHLDHYIIIANHNSHLDILLLFYLLPLGHIARTHAVAEEDYFSRSRIVFRLVRFLFRPVWVRRGEASAQHDPLEGIRHRLDAGHNIIVFPEGTRGRPGELEHFKSGIGRLIAEYPDIPVVPVFLVGPERVLPKSRALLLPFLCSVRIGPPRIWSGPHREITRGLEDQFTFLTHVTTGRSHARPRRRPPPPVVAIMGIDGSGKSTLSRALAERLSHHGLVARVSDQIELLRDGKQLPMQMFVAEHLREVIGRQAKTAASLKLYKIPKLAELLLRDHLSAQVARWYAPVHIVTDGSPLLNILAWSVLYKGDYLDATACAKAMAVLSGRWRDVGRRDPIFTRFPELAVFERLRFGRLMLPRAAVFLDVTPETACERIRNRGEPTQVHETAEKLGRLRRSYHLILDAAEQHRQIPVCRIAGAASPTAAADAAVTFVHANAPAGDSA